MIPIYGNGQISLMRGSLQQAVAACMSYSQTTPLRGSLKGLYRALIKEIPGFIYGVLTVALYGCFQVDVFGVLRIRALVFGVYPLGPVIFWTLSVRPVPRSLNGSGIPFKGFRDPFERVQGSLLKGSGIPLKGFRDPF